MSASTDEVPPAIDGLLRAQSAALRRPEDATALTVDDALTAGSALKGKVVVVTGAANGFGRAYANKVAEFGCVNEVAPPWTPSRGRRPGILPRRSPAAGTRLTVSCHECSAKVVLSDVRLESVQVVADEVTAAGGFVPTSALDGDSQLAPDPAAARTDRQPASHAT